MGRDTLKEYQFIEWNLNPEQLDGVCRMLQEQLGDNYIVIKPESKSKTIEFRVKDN